MANAVISRTGGGTESVTLPLREERGQLSVARDIGSPNTEFYNTGTEDPEPADHLSKQDTFTLVGVLRGSSAYSDAKTLAEDIIKRRPQSSDHIQLDLTDLPSGSTHTVAASSDSGVQLTYPAGSKDIVGVQMTLQVVDSVAGGSQSTQSTQTPDAGSGVKLTDGSNPVTLVGKNIEVVRTVGRQLQTVAAAQDDPSGFDLNKPAVDRFEITGTLFSDSAESDAKKLEESLMKSRQGAGALTLHFQSNLFGLDAYDVMPDGSQALRTLFSTGRKGIVEVPTLNLRVVDTK